VPAKFAGLSGVKVTAFELMAYVPSPGTTTETNAQFVGVYGAAMSTPQSFKVDESIVALPAAVSFASGATDNTWSCGPAT
jgi:hypothetical protein